MATKPGTSPWVWVLLLLLLASFVGFILFLDQKVVDGGRDDAVELQGGSRENKPKIDFYSVLPKRKVEIPISDEDRVAIENPTPNKEIEERYVLQVGSFQSADEADSLKAQLAFLGLEAKIEAAVVDDQTWHRVQLGPFASNSQLSRAQNLLLENEIDYIQRQLPP